MYVRGGLVVILWALICATATVSCFKIAAAPSCREHASPLETGSRSARPSVA